MAPLETTGVLLHSMPSRGRSKWGGWLAKVQTSEARLPRRVRRIAQPRLCRRHIKLEGGLLGERRNMWSIAVTPSNGLVLRIFTHRKQLPRALNPKPLAAKEVLSNRYKLKLQSRSTARAARRGERLNMLLGCQFWVQNARLKEVSGNRKVCLVEDLKVAPVCSCHPSLNRDVQTAEGPNSQTS